MCYHGELVVSFSGSREVSSHHDRIARALDVLTAGLSPYVEARLRAVYKENWLNMVSGSFRDDRARVNLQQETVDWDAHALLTVMWDQWNAVFRNELGHYERSMVSELREFRNRWAHQQEFDFDDSYRVLDSVRRLLKSTNAQNVSQLEREKQDLLEERVAEAVNTQVQRAAFRRNRFWVVGIYTTCCSLILGLMLYRPGDGISRGEFAIMATITLIFVYLTYLQFRLEPPLLFGPRECRDCRRIIYRQSCPYCHNGPEA